MIKLLIIGDLNNFKLSKLYKTINNFNNIVITKDIKSDYTCALKWCDYNEKELFYPNIPDNIKNVKIINKNFISQDRYYLEPYHKEAFGYDLNVNPLTYNGKIFRKGKCHNYKFLSMPENIVDDYHGKNEPPFYYKKGKNIRYMTFMGPIDKQDKNSVYQKCIERKNSNDFYQDYRLTIIDRKPFILLDTLHTDFIDHSILKKKNYNKKAGRLF